MAEAGRGAGEERVERLHGLDRGEARVEVGGEGQERAAGLGGTADAHRRTLRGEFSRRRQDVTLAGTRERQGEHGEAGVDDLARPVAQLGGAEGLGVQAAGLLELERHLLGDRQARAAAST